MRAMAKRFGACILAFVLAFTCVSVFSMDEVYAAAKVVHSGTNYGLSWKVYSDGRLVISGSGDANRAYRYNDVNTYEWVQYHDDITSVKISVSGMTDMSYLFYGLNNAKTFDISNLNTSKAKNMAYMFANCSSVTKLDVSKFNTAKVENMSYMFSGCEKLKALDLSGFNTSKVTLMSYMFYNCMELSKLDLSSFDTSNVVRMDRMFMNCNKLSAIDVSNFNTAQTTNMEWMFYGCTALKKLDLSGFYLGQIVNVEQMFYDCNKLSCTISLPKEPLVYAGLFNRAAIGKGAKIVVKYGKDCSREVAQEIMLKSKDAESNIELGAVDNSTDQKLKLKVSNKELQASKVKKASSSFSIGASAKNGITYKVAKGGKYITVSSKGKVTVKKGTPKGTYRVMVTAKSSSKYKKAVKQVFIVVK